MSKRRSGLGRGLDALLPSDGVRMSQLPLALIEPGPFQPRRRFNEASLQELAESVRVKGVLQPLLVRPKGDGYELVAGERRFRAAQLAGLTEVPAIIREMSDQEALELALVENLQREDLNPVEEALGYQRLIDLGLSQEEVAARVGKARSTVANALRLLQLPRAALEALEQGAITPGHARALLMLPESKRLWGLREILSRQLSVREAERLKARLGQPPQKRQAYPEVAAALEARLGVRVRITGHRRGRIELHYASAEELQALLDLLGYEG